jgi:hypothetical protein
MAGSITVACKIPNGLILRNFNMVEDHEPVLGGGTRAYKKAVQVGEPVKINGPATPHGQAPLVTIVGGYALTQGVDEEFFNKWIEDNKTHPAVVNRLIFAHSKPEMVTGAAKENEKRTSGLEGINPDGDARVSKSVRKMDNKVA